MGSGMSARRENPVDSAEKSRYNVKQPGEKEEYARSTARENGSPAERPFRKRRAEGRFGGPRMKQVSPRGRARYSAKRRPDGRE